MGTDFIVHHPEVKALTLTQPYHMFVDHGYGLEEVSLERISKQSYDLHLIEMLGREEHRACDHGIKYIVVQYRKTKKNAGDYVHRIVLYRVFCNYERF